MHRSNRALRVFVLLSALILLSSVGSGSMPTSAAAQTASDQSVIYLNQAWSQEDREWYYNFSQGSAVLSYDIFLNLEVAGGQELFRSDANLARYGLIPSPRIRYNPDGLPIGISKTVVATPVKGGRPGDYVGLTCAACHEGQLDYKGKHIRIDGGVAHTFDFRRSLGASTMRLQATLTDTAKFDRLAARLGASSADAKRQIAQAIRERGGSGARICHPNLGHPSSVGPGPHGCPPHDRQSSDGHVDGNSREHWSLPSRRSSRRSSGTHRKDCGPSGPACATIRSAVIWRDDGRIPAH